LFEISFGLTHVFRAKISQLDAGNSYRASQAFGEVGLAGSYRTAHEVSHRCGIEPALGDQRGVLGKPSLDGVVADEVVKRVWWLDKFDEPSRLPLDQAFLELFERDGTELSSRLCSMREQSLEIDEVQSAGELGQLRRQKIGEVPRSAILMVVPGHEGFAR